MPSKQARKNPFYVVLVLVGVAFLLTASLYGVMAFREAKGYQADESGAGLLAVMDRYGVWLLGGEVALLILSSVAAMATDSFWTKSRVGPARAASAGPPCCKEPP